MTPLLIAMLVSALVCLVVWAAETPLGLLNFLVLQWFGVRLRASFDRELVPNGTKGGRWWSWHAPPRGVPVTWHLVRWAWPLTGWWSSHSWIRKHRGR